MSLNSQATDDDLKSQLDLIIQFVEEIEPERNPHEEDVLQTSQISDAPSLARVEKVKEPKLSEEARARLIPPMRLQQGVEIRDLGCRLETVSSAILEETKCGRFAKTSRITSNELEGPATINGVDVRQSSIKVDNSGKLASGNNLTKTQQASLESVCSLSLADPSQPTPSPRLKRKQKAPQPPLSKASGGRSDEGLPAKEGSGISGFDNLISDLCVYTSNIESEVTLTQKKEDDRRSQVENKCPLNNYFFLVLGRQ